MSSAPVPPTDTLFTLSPPPPSPSHFPPGAAADGGPSTAPSVGAAHLGNTEAYARNEARRHRVRLREALRPVQDSKAGCCGRWALSDRLTVVMRDGRASVGGTMRCGRIWTCPMCSAIVGQARAEELSEAARRHMATGGAVYLVTMTVRHRDGLPLAHVLDVLSRARSRLVRGYWWRQAAKEIGLVGWARAVEITVSTQRGWHPHAHWLVFLERSLPEVELGAWWLGLATTWADMVAKEDPSLCPEQVLLGPGVDVRQVADDEDIGAYLTKDSVAGVGMELARPEAKRGRSRSFTAFELGEQAAAGNLRAVGWWQEYQQATRGRHRLQWSRGLRERLGLMDDRTDEELLEDTEADETVAELGPAESALLLFAPHLGPLVCESAEAGGAEAVHKTLRAAWQALSWSDRAHIRRWARNRTINR